MENNQAKKKKSAKWYDSPLNSRIRELLHQNEIKTEDFARITGVSTEAVRLWCSGYSRPDIDKLIIIANYLKVSTDYLLGKTETKSSDTVIQAIGYYTGLNDAVLEFILDAKAANNILSQRKTPDGINITKTSSLVGDTHMRESGYLNIINLLLFSHHKKRIEMLLNNIRGYLNTLTKFILKRIKTAEKLKHSTAPLQVLIDLDEAVKFGIDSVHSDLDNELKQDIQNIRVSKYNITETFRVLIDELTNKYIEIVNEEECGENGKHNETDK